MDKRAADVQRTFQGLTVEFKLDGSLLYLFSHLLQQGVGVRARVGCSIREFLCGRLGIRPEYVKERIQTIFLNGRPVDDERTAMLADGDTLALSASMPGALGATMRKGGFFSPLRYQISHTPDDRPPAVADGTVIVKLFNTILKELGPLVLSRGVCIDGKTLAELLARQGEVFWQGCGDFHVNGEIVDRKALSEVNWPHRAIFLKVRTMDASLT